MDLQLVNEDVDKEVDKEAIIKDFITIYAHNPIQGSEEWLKLRNNIIGGSEISTIMGLNPFNNIEKLVAQKVNLEKFSGSPATRWGNLFENVSEILTKILFNTKIYNTGSIRHKTITNHGYSPDGICIINYNTFKETKKNTFELQNEEKITLLEFKAPYGTIPTDKVPKYYLPQVKSGLCSVPITETALFINNMFRKCSIEQLDFDIDYDTKYHNKDNEKKLADIDSTIANGIIFLSIPCEKIHIFTKKFNEIITTVDPFSDDDEVDHGFNISDTESHFDPTDIEVLDDGTNILYKIKRILLNYETLESKKLEMTKRMYTNTMSRVLMDFGILNKKLFDQFLLIYKNDNEESFIKTTFIKPQINPDIFDECNKNLIIPEELKYIRKPEYFNRICKNYNSNKLINKFINNCKEDGSIPIGYLPWKLFRSSIIKVEKEDDFLDNLKEKIDSVVNTITDISNSNSQDELLDNFEKHFKESKIVKKIREQNSFINSYKDFF